MKKIFGIIALAFFCSLAGPKAHAEPKHAAIVVEAQSGKVLESQSSESLRHPASLTKIMTLYMAFKAIKQGKLRMNQRLRVSAYAASQAPSKLGLKRGSTIRTRDAILGLVTQSANDAAVVLAEAIGGTESNFAKMMTQQARQLRMNKTLFRNASGLPDDRQVTTARDMAILARAMLFNFSDYYPLFRTKRFTYLGVTHDNHNHLMERYPGMDGIKTGYIRASGFNLVSSAVRGKTRLIAVIFGGSSARSRDQDMAVMLDRNFASLTKRKPPVAAAPLVASSPSGPPVIAQGDAADTEESAETGLIQPAQPAALAPVSLQGTPQFAREISKNGNAAAPAPPGDATAFPLRKPAALATAPEAAATAAPPAKIPGWGVQIGAYRDRASSEKAVRSLGQRLPRHIRDARYEIVALKTAYATVYRVRLLGLDEKSARKLCRSAAGDGRNCILIPPSAS